MDKRALKLFMGMGQGQGQGQGVSQVGIGIGTPNSLIHKMQKEYVSLFEST